MSTTPSNVVEAAAAAVIDWTKAELAEVRSRIAATATSGKTWADLPVPALTDQAGWALTGSVTVAGGRMTVQGEYMAGKAYQYVDVTPGEMVRVTITVDPLSTGAYLPYLGFVDRVSSPWGWPDAVDLTPAIDIETGSRTWTATVPDSATAIYVGAQSAGSTGTTVITSIRVERTMPGTSSAGGTAPAGTASTANLAALITN